MVYIFTPTNNNIMTTKSVIKLAKKIYSGCERTPYIKSQAIKADFYLTINDLRDMEMEVEENCFTDLEAVFGSVINGEV